MSKHRRHQDKPHEKEPEKQPTPSSEKGEKAERKKEGASAPSSESRDLRDSRISTMIFALAGVIMGLASSVLKSSGISSYITVTLGLIFLAVLMGAMQKMFGRKIKFFLGGAFAYLFIWLVFWIFLYNM
jgi:predicted Co/Zn/Cd cation transporter (cation efflux family)